MVNMDNYPPGAENDSSAPWCEPELEPREVEVTVSITLSKTLKVEVRDYLIDNLGLDEDGNPWIEYNYKDSDLKSAVEDQIILPNEAYKYTVPNPRFLRDLKGWNVDDLEVCLEE